MELIYKQTGPRMSKIVIAGEVAYIAGQLPDPGCPLEVQEQARLVLAKITELLDAAGSSRERLIMASVYLSDIGFFEAFNEVWDAWVVPGHTPARVCIESRLARPEWKVEVAVVAALKSK